MFALLGSPRRIGVGAAALAAAMLLTGCAAGQKAATAEENPTLDGVSATVGTCQIGQTCINLDALSIAPPTTSDFYAKGSDAPLRLLIVNSGQQNDTLTSVTTDAASSTSFVAPSADATASNACVSSTSAPASPHSAKPTVTPTPCITPAAPQNPSSIDVAAGERVSVGFDAKDIDIDMSDLQLDLYPAQSVALTFTFAKAGATTVTVPVHTIPQLSSPLTVDVQPKSE